MTSYFSINRAKIREMFLSVTYPDFEFRGGEGSRGRSIFYYFFFQNDKIHRLIIICILYENVHTVRTTIDELFVDIWFFLIFVGYN